MTDKLIDRLRGKYKIGPDGMYGTRDFSGFTPPICAEAADRIEELEQQIESMKNCYNCKHIYDPQIAMTVKELKATRCWQCKDSGNLKNWEFKGEAW